MRFGHREVLGYSFSISSLVFATFSSGTFSRRVRIMVWVSVLRGLNLFGNKAEGLREMKLRHQTMTEKRWLPSVLPDLHASFSQEQSFHLTQSARQLWHRAGGGTVFYFFHSQ